MRPVSERSAAAVGALVGIGAYLLVSDKPSLVSYSLWSVLVACMAMVGAAVLNRALPHDNSDGYKNWEIGKLLPKIVDSQNSGGGRAVALLAVLLTLLAVSIIGFWGGFVLSHIFNRG